MKLTRYYIRGVGVVLIIAWVTGAGLVGLVYYNPEIHSDNYNHINIPKLGHYIHEYGLKDTGSIKITDHPM